MYIKSHSSLAKKISVLQQCLICHKDFENKIVFGRHMKLHNMTPYQYRKKFNLIAKCKTCNVDLSIGNASGLCANCRNSPMFGKKHTQKVRNKISKSRTRYLKKNNLSRWYVRKKQSYAEKFFETVLSNNSIFDFVKEFKVVKSNLRVNKCYFLDFYFPSIGLDLEIDGSQHKIRKRQDKSRDKFLNDSGIVVYRIEWKNINSESCKLYMKNEIKKFIDFYNFLSNKNIVAV